MTQRKTKRWESEEDQYLKDNWLTQPTRTTAKHLKRSVASVTYRATAVLNLKKSNSIDETKLKQRKEAFLEILSSNPGLSLTEAIEKSEFTQYLFFKTKKEDQEFSRKVETIKTEWKKKNTKKDKKLRKENRKIWRKKYKKTVRGYLQGLVRSTHTSAKTKSLDHNINLDFLHTMWVKQKGRCIYSGLNMIITSQRHPLKPTVDKIDPNKGYTTDNVVLCCYAINLIKNNLEKSKFIDMCKDIVENEKRRNNAS